MVLATVNIMSLLCKTECSFVAADTLIIMNIQKSGDGRSGDLLCQKRIEKGLLKAARCWTHHCLTNRGGSKVQNVSWLSATQLKQEPSRSMPGFFEVCGCGCLGLTSSQFPVRGFKTPPWNQRSKLTALQRFHTGLPDSGTLCDHAWSTLQQPITQKSHHQKEPLCLCCSNAEDEEPELQALGNVLQSWRRLRRQFGSVRPF